MRLATSRVHFIGIGGIGMCGLAELLHNMGAKVSGSDLAENAQTERLKHLGIPVFKGHSADNLRSCEVVVFSGAVGPKNVEYAEARARKIPLIPRAEALAEIMRLKRGIAVAGSHGKTTTTSLIASVFLQAKADPTLVIGGRLDVIQSTAQLGQGQWLIAEADESDGSFNRLAPEIVVITNIDNDHLDYYKSFDRIQNAFLDFASRIPFYGSLIICGDDERVRELFKDFGKRILYYGTKAHNDYRLVGEGRGHYQILHGDRRLVAIKPPLPGLHNALNSTAALLVGMECGLPLHECVAGIENFRGVDRRFQKRGEVRGILHYDDYGHHPTEIRAVLQGFREYFPDRRLVVLFQPHRFSRTQLCWEQFLTCFKDCDQVFVLDVYPAGETAIPGIDSQALVKNIEHPAARYLPLNNLMLIRENLKAGDVFITLGAGDVWKLGDKILHSDHL